MDEDASSVRAKKLPFTPTKDEYLVREFPRSKLPYLFILFVTLLASGFFFLTYIDISTGGYGWLRRMTGMSIQTAKDAAPILIVLSLIAILGGVITAYIYSVNRMFLTNEHVIRIKQDGLVAVDKKVISHLNIEDIKARQNFVGGLLGYGLLTMSTEGQNATYEINFIRKPFEQVNVATEVRDDYQQSVIDMGGQAIPISEER